MTSSTIMGTITKNYIIILFEKIIMKKECQYCHHQRHHHPVGRTYCMQIEHVIRSISPLWTNQLRFFCRLVFLFLLPWSYVLFLSNFSLLSNLIFFAGCSTLHSSDFGWFRTRIEGEKRNHLSFADCSTPIMCRHISWTLYYVDTHWITRIIE